MTPYYENKTTTLYRGNCLEVMPQLDAQSVDAIICDPPYGTTACSWDSVIPFDAMWTNIKRLLKPGGACVLFGSEPFSSLLRCSNLDWYRYDWIWEKSEGTGFLDASSRPLKCHEAISVFGEKEPTYYPQKWQGAPSHTRAAQIGGKTSEIYRGVYSRTESDTSGEKYPRSVVAFPIIKPQKRRHPNEKPLNLMRYLVRTYTQPGDVILDFSSGSGSTLEAAMSEDRRSIGIERDIDNKGTTLGYCETTVQRLRGERVHSHGEVGQKTVTLQKSLFVEGLR